MAITIGIIKIKSTKIKKTRTMLWKFPLKTFEKSLNIVLKVNVVKIYHLNLMLFKTILLNIK